MIEILRLILPCFLAFFSENFTFPGLKRQIYPFFDPFCPNPANNYVTSLCVEFV